MILLAILILMLIVILIVSLSTQASTKNIESDDSIDCGELLDEEIYQFQQQPTFFVCSASIGRTVKCLSFWQIVFIFYYGWVVWLFKIIPLVSFATSSEFNDVHCAFSTFPMVATSVEKHNIFATIEIIIGNWISWEASQCSSTLFGPPCAIGWCTDGDFPGYNYLLLLGKKYLLFLRQLKIKISYNILLNVLPLFYDLILSHFFLC